MSNKPYEEYIGMTELVLFVESWAEERGLKSADPAKQMVKLMEEVGELAEGLSKSNIDLIKDGIGDAVVVLTILALQVHSNIEDCLRIAYNEIKDRKGKMINGVFVKESDLHEMSKQGEKQ